MFVEDVHLTLHFHRVTVDRVPDTHTKIQTNARSETGFGLRYIFFHFEMMLNRIRCLMGKGVEGVEGGVATWKESRV